jgi:acyl carrier protein
MSLRDELTALIEEWDVERGDHLQEDTSLIRSGLLDSMALFNLAMWIERQIGAPIDPSSFDLSREWDTMSDIVNFIEKRRQAGSPAAGSAARRG